MKEVKKENGRKDSVSGWCKCNWKWFIDWWHV